MTTISLLFTGKLLDQVSRWRAMREVDQLIMIIPVVLNLKGNLEMNLSARLGTAANIGELDDPLVRRSMIVGNLSLLQVQAISVSFIASCTALVLGRFVPQNSPMPVKGSPAIKNSTATARDIHNYTTIDFRHAITLPSTGTIRKSGFPRLIMVASTAMFGACLSGLILGSFMCTLIVLCRKFHRDPDNIAPPVASCLGDIIILILTGVQSNLLVLLLRTPIHFILGLFVVGGVLCVHTAEHTRPASPNTGIHIPMIARWDGHRITGHNRITASIFISRLSSSLHATAVALSHPSASAKVRKYHGPSPGLVMLPLNSRCFSSRCRRNHIPWRT
ncbi:Mg transporter [Laccaria bicolor S238N-H82]|uniref:Mg transporter n=1 Tax=Laccaria bicolor (strain S238N-H82 / ATCC MYA-4686) TaxID=486041 RepID=B0D2T8_LACBS|nr:Mg transporter [Laccaria bicolor S238N-H82]EDR11152.1 Mg transporter [Laccaria bicolor S238N-H82]|eukprot:XP_001878453.1 Mg transporter [Laccaria bicolor S238N-H82]